MKKTKVKGREGEHVVKFLAFRGAQSEYVSLRRDSELADKRGNIFRIVSLTRRIMR